MYISVSVFDGVFRFYPQFNSRIVNVGTVSSLNIESVFRSFSFPIFAGVPVIEVIPDGSDPDE